MSDRTPSAARISELEREVRDAYRVIWWLVRQQPRHRIDLFPTMHRDREMELVREPIINKDGMRFVAAVVYDGHDDA